MNEQARKALELARASLENFWLNGQSTQSERAEASQAIAVIDAALSALETPVANAGWMKSGALLYRLTDDRKPVNRDEIRVTMADGSRTDEACSRRAGELFDRLASAPAAPVAHAAQPVSEPSDEKIEAALICAGAKWEQDNCRWVFESADMLPAIRTVLALRWFKAQLLTDEKIRELWFAAEPTPDGRSSSWSFARSVERACAEAWGVKLDGIGQGGADKPAPAAPVALTRDHVMSALAFVPTDMGHPDKCEWIASYLNGIGQEGGAA